MYIYCLLMLLCDMYWVFKSGIVYFIVFGFFGGFCFFLTVDVAVFAHNSFATLTPALRFCDNL